MQNANLPGVKCPSLLPEDASGGFYEGGMATIWGVQFVVRSYPDKPDLKSKTALRVTIITDDPLAEPIEQHWNLGDTDKFMPLGADGNLCEEGGIWIQSLTSTTTPNKNCAFQQLVKHAVNPKLENSGYFRDALVNQNIAALNGLSVEFEQLKMESFNRDDKKDDDKKDDGWSVLIIKKIVALPVPGQQAPAALTAGAVPPPPPAQTPPVQAPPAAPPVQQPVSQQPVPQAPPVQAPATQPAPVTQAPVQQPAQAPVQQPQAPVQQPAQAPAAPVAQADEDYVRQIITTILAEKPAGVPKMALVAVAATKGCSKQHFAYLQSDEFLRRPGQPWAINEAGLLTSLPAA